MSKEHPTPWTFHAVDACEDQPILDANGNEVLVRDSGVYPPDLDTCREIVDAVNERERLRAELADKARNYEDVIAFHIRTEESLRDIVRRLLPLAETTVENIRALGTARFPFLEQIKSDRLRGDINREVANADHLLRDARDAIGEDAK